MATAQAAAARLARGEATAAAAAEVAAAEAAIREQRLRQPGVLRAVSALQARVRARRLKPLTWCAWRCSRSADMSRSARTKRSKNKNEYRQSHETFRQKFLSFFRAP